MGDVIKFQGAKAQADSGAAGTAKFLINDAGEWLDANDPATHAKIGYAEPDFDLGGYVIHTMGIVEASISQRAGGVVATVRFRPLVVKEGIVEATIGRLFASGCRKVTLRYMLRAWVEETYLNAEDALARVAELLLTRPYRQASGRFVAQAIDPRMALSDLGDQLGRVLRMHADNKGLMTNDAFAFIEKSKVGDRSAVLRLGRHDIVPVYRWVGMGFSVYKSKEKLTALIGRKSDQHADREYGRWVTSSICRVANSGEPCLEDCDALIQEPGSDAVRRVYRRLILPWTASNGDRYITTSGVV